MTERSQIVILANRLPIHQARQAGQMAWETSPGGLVTALTPILREHPSTWIGWIGAAGEAPEPFVHNGTQQVAIPLSREEVRAYYVGFANRTIWPLYHDAVRPPEFQRPWWHAYAAINRRFAEAAAESAAEKGIVWVHDYHLQLVPAMLRRLRPDLRIGFFLHIPFPPPELFAQIPWRRQILEGLLGADVIGFQTRRGAANFAQLVRRFTDATGTREALVHEGRNIRAASFPISIDVRQVEEIARSPEAEERQRTHRERLGHERLILLGVDRLDYTKGIDIRLHAFQELLRSGRLSADRAVLVQVAVPSRERVAEYREQRARVAQLVGEINGEFGDVGRFPVHYLHRGLPPDELIGLYRAADVMLVTPLRDGMNLVAKEYVASRIDERGALVLSEFTGAAHELTSAVLVNPHDIDDVESAIERAYHMPLGEQARRMRALRRAVQRNDVFHWAQTFFDSLTA